MSPFVIVTITLKRYKDKLKLSNFIDTS